MGVSLKQSSFSAGVVSPQLRGRTDTQKYASGLRVCTNAVITRYGTIENRPGSVFDVETKDSSKRIRIDPFIFSQDISYVLEVGEDYIRPLRNGAHIDVTGAAAWSNVAAYLIGELVTYLGLVYRALADTTGDTPDSTPLVWNPQSGNILTIVTDVPQAALALHQYVQQNDVMTLTSHEMHPKQLLRYSETRWVWQDFETSTGIGPPTGVAVVAGFPSSAIDPPTNVAASGGTAHFAGTYYSVSSYTNSPAQESSILRFHHNNLAPDPGNPVTVTWTAAAGVDGYAIYREDGANPSSLIASIIGVTDDTMFVDSLETTDLFGAAGIKNTPGHDDQAGATIWTYVVTSVDADTGSESAGSPETSAVGATPTTGHPNVVSWITVVDASDYRVYRSVNGVLGFIGSAGNTTTFRDNNIIPDTSIQPPTEIPLFDTSDDWPAACSYYQQRLMLANTINQPQTVWGSRVGDDTNFAVSTPVHDDDAIQFVIAGRQVQPVQAMVDLGKLVLHTSNAEYVASGNTAGALTPTSIGLVANGSAGAQPIAPVVIGNTDLFVQNGSTRLLDLRYEVQSFSYAGKDLTKYATGLFAGRTIVDMAWQKIPHSIVWCVLDSGALVGLTYVREDELWAWHAHVTTNGTFENVCVVPEGTEQKVYVVVKRTIDGQVVRYIENLASRECLDTVFFSDSVFCDSSLTYDGRNTGSTTMTVTTGAGWTPVDLVTITASGAEFSSGDIGNQVVLQQLADGTEIDPNTGLPYAVGTVLDVVSFQVTGYTSTTVVTGNPLRTVPTWARATATTTWGRAVKMFTGIDHLEGQDLSILADGSVVANPLNEDLPAVTVSGGSFTLTNPAMVVTAGLPIQVDVETLPVENATGETIANKRVKVAEVCPIFSASRGGQYGQDSSHLDTWKQPANPRYGYPPPALTGPYRLPIRGSWQTTGQLAMRVIDPVPWSISAVVISGDTGN